MVSIIGLPVTAGNDQFAGIFYIEDKQRIQGIKVVWNESTIFEGMVVTVSGTITTANGERQINATSVTVSPTPEVFLVPFGIRPAYMGGVAAGLVPGVVGGVMGPRGANNIGLLVKCWGVVQNAAGGYFELREPNGEVVRVKTPSALPTEGLMYAVTGISSCEPVTGGYGSLLLARKAVDVQALQLSLRFLDDTNIGNAARLLSACGARMEARLYEECILKYACSCDCGRVISCVVFMCTAGIRSIDERRLDEVSV